MIHSVVIGIRKQRGEIHLAVLVFEQILLYSLFIVDLIILSMKIEILLTLKIRNNKIRILSIKVHDIKIAVTTPSTIKTRIIGLYSLTKVKVSFMKLFRICRLS